MRANNRTKTLVLDTKDSKCITDLKEKRRSQRTYTITNTGEGNKLNEVIEEWEVIKTQLRERSVEPELKRNECMSPNMSTGSFIDIIKHSSEKSPKSSHGSKYTCTGKILFGRKKPPTHSQMLVSHDEELLMKLLHFKDEMLNKTPKKIIKVTNVMTPRNKPKMKQSASSLNLKETSCSPPKTKLKKEKSFLLKTMKI
ncbi:unnamed protein product [Blepharisma stoltei]|uniref:Uncharacterized protein n=1 Tax=Blepharisma stoltei TaxID=1481888 RepID=A0AAU9K5R8_9CILI|nr:unnamed protein product [Blepharisma stoltei]